MGSSVPEGLVTSVLVIKPKARPQILYGISDAVVVFDINLLVLD